MGGKTVSDEACTQGSSQLHCSVERHKLHHLPQGLLEVINIRYGEEATPTCQKQTLQPMSRKKD